MDIEDKEAAEIRRGHNRKIMENPKFQKARKTTDGLILLAWDWMEKIIEEAEDVNVCSAREKARSELDWMARTRPVYFLEYFKQTAKELEVDKPLEKMTDKEKLEVIIQMFNEEAIEGD